ncbi:MAG: ClpXP protease specificity-enhancing factor [Burkholderiaceae bacterium]|jgi:stringent starvation protein B|nr:ClpXP protease specificity-enhancing factor [Burkholderiaceae bacterium]MDP4669917.1 ClpXP protease specificity-enhancing factor [Burkholderiaceae bacterium]
MTDQTSTKPYLIRALYEWCTDNGLTPYLAVSVNEHTRVPRAHVRNGEIVLNISALASHRLQLTNTEVSFTARFSGMAEEIWVPIAQVTAIYAKETGHGMAFEVSKPPAELVVVEGSAEDEADSQQVDPPPPPKPPTKTGPGGRPTLRRVK